ncbi:hypothetical protein LptCag_1512 [Leptospirillum ferriphilum]|uniref:Uncharacterized protein n=1 Tax=Leptospirillum ferriphilum TaxID=178606 RepID=A0A094WDT8_9BACT|nr:hypothetical protein LptCag_1512 [Leptospirillum ferriphilum]
MRHHKKTPLVRWTLSLFLDQKFDINSFRNIYIISKNNFFMKTEFIGKKRRRLFRWVW